MSKLIFGCGYLGKRVAKLWLEQGQEVHVVTRSAERAKALAEEGYLPLVGDVTEPDRFPDLPEAKTVLFAVGFDRTVGNSIMEVYAEGVKNTLARLPNSVERFIYISTTGVYGSADGGWVDETTAPAPHREGGKASLAAEQALDTRGIVLRLAGIYGPGRVPYLDKLKNGEPIAAPSEGWLNLIHVDDGAHIVLAAESWSHNQPTGPHTFCVCDGHPVVRREYYQEVARQIAAGPPVFTSPNAGSPAAARAAADKRVSNRKLLETLGVEMAFPSYREGLASILANHNP